MSIIRTVLSTAAVGAALVAAATARPATAEADVAEKYFGCPTGYTFQTSGNNARCHVAGAQQTADIMCGFGYVKALDQFNGGKDACQHQKSNIVGNYTCPAGFSPKVQPGPDQCIKAATSSVMAPTVERWL